MVVFSAMRKLDDVNLSMKLRYSYYIRPNDNLEFPMMDCCFVDSRHIAGDNIILSAKERLHEEVIFVNMFITKTFQMVSILYDYKTQKVTSKDTKVDVMHTNGV